MKVHTVILLAGGNDKNSGELLLKALQMLEKEVGKIVTKSAIYRTAAWGPIPQPDFMNLAILMRSKLPPKFLLRRILDIETRLGRVRTVKYGPRTIDIDILFYGSQIIKTDSLTIPHPEIANRRFVLMPCNEISPNFVHPLLKKPIRQLLLECKDELEVKLWA